MNNRITNKDLDRLVDTLNELTGNDKKPYNPETRKANIGNYHIDSAYGGVQLVQMMSDTGGIRSISHGGYEPKRDLYSFLTAYVAGIQRGQQS